MIQVVLKHLLNKIIFKLLEKQIPGFGEISPTFLSKSVICFQEK